MNRRSILKSVIGMCAAIICPWRQVKASPSWAYEVTWRMGKCEIGCMNKQFNRIKRVMRTNEPRRTLVGKLGSVGPIVVFDVKSERPVWARSWATRVRFTNSEKDALVYINDSVAASLTDGQLFYHIMQGFLKSLQVNRAVSIRPTEENTG